MGINLEVRHILFEILKVIYLAKGFKIKKRFWTLERKLVVEEGDDEKSGKESKNL